MSVTSISLFIITLAFIDKTKAASGRLFPDTAIIKPACVILSVIVTVIKDVRLGTAAVDKPLAHLAAAL